MKKILCLICIALLASNVALARTSSSVHAKKVHNSTVQETKKDVQDETNAAEDKSQVQKDQDGDTSAHKDVKSNDTKQEKLKSQSRKSATSRSSSRSSSRRKAKTSTKNYNKNTNEQENNVTENDKEDHEEHTSEANDNTNSKAKSTTRKTRPSRASLRRAASKNK